MIKRLFLLAASCLALAGVNQAWATIHNPTTEGDPRTSYVDKFTVPATSNMLLYANLKLSKVTGIKGDLWCYHTNQSIPWLFECEGPLEASANKEGVYNWEYDAEAGTIKCEFQGKWNYAYMMTAIVTLTQGEDGKSVYAQVTKTAYPWNEAYGFDSTNYGGTWGANYYEGLDQNAASGMVRVSLHNIELTFVADGETRNVTFVDKDGNQIGDVQAVEFGTAATAPTEDQIPTVEGYKFAGWDKDFSAVKDDITVKAVYHKLCTVTFVDKLGNVLKTQENVEETTAAEPPTAAEVPNVTITDGADAGEYVFNGTWDPDYKSIKDNTTITAQYNKLCTVKFVDKNDNVVDTQSVQTTKDAVDPTTKGITMSNPDGFVWIGWEESFTNIQGDLTVHAKYHTLYDVTFVNYYGETIATVPTEETKAAVAPTDVPEVTIKEGEDDAGRRLVFNGTWDTDFSNITGAITVKANYNKIFKVTFKDAEAYGGSEISVVEVEQGKEATQPDMSAYYSKGFKGWGDAEGNAVSIKDVQSDLTVIALYGSLPTDVSFAQDSGLLTDESNVLIYTGTSGQNWDTEGVWYTLEGQVSGWTSGATAVFATDKTVDVASAQTVGKMIFLGQAKKVTFTGEDITFDGAATVQFNASATARFENNILGSAGLVVTAAVETVATDAATTTADYDAALEIAGNYGAGNLTIARAKVKTVGEGTLGGGTFNSETAIKENGVLSLGSTVAQTMSGKITVTKVTINKVDVYQGYVQTEKGSTVTFNADQGNAWELRIAGVAYATGYRTLPTSGTESEIKVLDGGSLVLQSTLGGWGPNSWNGTENKGCLVLTNGLLRLAHENSSGCLLGYVIDGGTVTNEITAAGKGPLLYKFTVKNGATLKGGAMRVGYTDYYNIWSYLRVGGETPSTVELDAIQIGYQKKAENNKYVGINFQVSDVTGDDGVDLYVKSPITENTGLSYASGYRTNMGVYKQGAGTVELSASTSCCTTGVFKIEAGTVRFPAKSAGRFGALQVTGDCTMDVARSARIEFDAATEAWTAGKTLVLTGDIGPKSIRVGTDATGLSADQLAQIKYRFGDGADDLASVGIDANGYLTCRYFHRGLVFVIE